MKQRDFEILTAEERLALARDGSAEEINLLARDFRWSIWPLDALSVVVQRPDLTLCTAVQTFIMGIPDDYEDGLAPDPDWFDEQVFTVLTILHDRLNAGAYPHREGDDVEDAHQLPRFVEGMSRPEGSVWKLDPARIAPVWQTHHGKDFLARQSMTEAERAAEHEARMRAASAASRRAIGPRGPIGWLLKRLGY